MRMTVQFDDGSSQELVSTPGEIMPWTAHDLDWLGRSRCGHPDFPRLANLDGAPETVQVLYDHTQDFTAGWQWYAFGLLALQMYGQADRKKLTSAQFERIASAFNSLYWSGRFITNKHGVDNCRNEIAGKRLELGWPKYMTITTGGNLLRLTGRKSSREGKWWHEFETLDMLMPAPQVADVNQFTHPHLVHYATISRRDRTVIQFPQLGGLSVPFPVISKGGLNWIADERVVFDRPQELYLP